jgi:SAM-dependent methyltransferase
MDLKEEDILGEGINRHWYYVSKGRAMRRALGSILVPEVLDVGAGSGVFSKQLLDAGLCNSAVCVDPNYTDERTELHNGKQIRFTRAIDRNSSSLTLMMDVLEHVEDDVGLLKQYVDGMTPGGHVFITVPAFQFMWSGHDVFLEHFRRYTVKGLEEVVRKSGMTPVRTTYFFGSLFPVMAAARLAKRCLLNHGKAKPKSDLRVYPDWLNRSLIALHDVERGTFFDVNRIFGLSVFCLCRK